MDISAGFLVVQVINLLVVVSIIGFVIIRLSTSKISKKYRAHIRELKKQNVYKDWAEKHRNLVMDQNILNYASAIFIVAALVLFGTVKENLSAPRIVLIISGSLVYIFWPFSFILMVIISRLYKNVPELQNHSK